MDTLITAAISVGVSFASSFTTYFFTRKKYNVEVKGGSINNMDDSLDFYIKLSNDNKSKLDTLSKENETLRAKLEEILGENVKLMEEVLTLKTQISNLTELIEQNGANT